MHLVGNGDSRVQGRRRRRRLCESLLCWGGRDEEAKVLTCGVSTTKRERQRIEEEEEIAVHDKAISSLLSFFVSWISLSLLYLFIPPWFSLYMSLLWWSPFSLSVSWLDLHTRGFVVLCFLLRCLVAFSLATWSHHDEKCRNRRKGKKKKKQRRALGGCSLKFSCRTHVF